MELDGEGWIISLVTLAVTVLFWAITSFFSLLGSSRIVYVLTMLPALESTYMSASLAVSLLSSERSEKNLELSCTSFLGTL